MKKLIIFDFDGVLVETEWNTFVYYQDYLKKHHGIIIPDDHFKYKMGHKSVDFFSEILSDEERKIVDTKILCDMKRKDFMNNPEKYVNKIFFSTEILEYLTSKGYILALGSQNEREMIDKTLDYYDFKKYFSFTTSMQDITAKKPDPDVFKKCLDFFKLLPKDAIVIEDSPHGIEAAKKLGIKSIGITTSYSSKQLFAADIIISKLSEIDQVMIESI
jgi:beta-phosphoglucomutase-like phosphatase (HAD superfamily)